MSLAGHITYCLRSVLLTCGIACGAIAQLAVAEQTAAPRFADHVQPILTKYCTGCHNADDREGDLALETFADFEQGLDDGPLVLGGEPDASRLFRVITGQAEPMMPPEDHERPTAAEITILRAWIEAGAAGPDGEQSGTRRLIVPEIAPAEVSRPITALAAPPAGDDLAIARFARVVVTAPASPQPRFSIDDFPGKVNAIDFAPTGETLITASGIAGLYGRADLWDATSGENKGRFTGHRDTLYDAALSPDGRTLATASYDRQVILWDVASGKKLHTLTGHNGAVFDVDFDPAGNVLASASADETVKLWRVDDGRRLDTLSQPEGEQYTVEFSPDGTMIVAGGADSRIRVWQFVSRARARINPLRFTRHAHDGAVVKLKFAAGGDVLVSAGGDRSLRVWETGRFANSVWLENQPAAIHDMAVNAAGDRLAVARLDGSWDWYDLARVPAHEAESPVSDVATAQQPAAHDATEVAKINETEPNDTPAAAQKIALPMRIAGTIHSTDADAADVDVYRFTAARGTALVLETNAARQESPLDTKIAVLTPSGEPIERIKLQAVRESYFTFRGKDSRQTGDFRLHNWQDMQLNNYLYAGGEVVRLLLYPRGPDSGFLVYPGTNERWTYFGTTAVAHALNEPAYIVEPHPPHATLVPTGLPVFPIYFENDDDPQRELGTDSRLIFTAPDDGEYLVAVRDVRGFGGEDYAYELTVRPPQPDFEVTVALANSTIQAGSGQEVTVTVDRHDGFDGPIRIDLAGLPTGFYASTPVVVEAGHIQAHATIYTTAETPAPPADNGAQVQVTARAGVAGREVTKTVPWKDDLQLGDAPPFTVQVLPPSAQAADDPVGPVPGEPVELTVAPGETVSAVVRLVRQDGFDDEVRLGKEHAGRNLPHGVYVDNIGLNGLLVNQATDQREFFITADTWVPGTRRMFHLRTDDHGNLTSWPVVIHVRATDSLAAKSTAAPANKRP